MTYEPTMSGIPVYRPTAYRHASGDDNAGCIACWMDADEDLYGEPLHACCKEPCDDGEGYCGLCGHVLEAVGASPLTLPAEACE